jgi:hypothetical protein
MAEPGAREPERLRLRAVDQEDLHVIAAVLQDALTSLSEMAFVKGEARFMAAFLRFRREDQRNEAGPLLQCECALTFDHVESVRYRGIDPKLGRVRLELLTLFGEADGEAGSRIILVFAGGAAIQLEARKIEVRLHDFGECAPASVIPSHAVIRQSEA